jgi:hypothetical protein
MASSIQQFTHDLLSHHGALVDPAGDDGLDVVAGVDLQARLGLADYQRLVFSPDAVGSGQLVDYDSPLLEQMGRLVDTTRRVAFVRGPLRSSKSVDAEREIARAVSLQNGVYRVRGMLLVDVIDFGFVFEYSLLADDRTSGLVQVWINPATRSVPRLTSWFGAAEIADDERSLALGEAVDVPWALAIGAAHAALGASIDEFVLSLTRRRDRDVVRIRDYYEEIDREIRRKLTRVRSNEEARRREIDRLDATAASYRARLADVAERARVRVRVVPIAVFACRMPTWQITVRLKRRTATADALFSWNPIDGRVEARACDGCETPVETALLCDDRVHYLCTRCLEPCPACGRQYCRACHKMCPVRHERA